MIIILRFLCLKSFTDLKPGVLNYHRGGIPLPSGSLTKYQRQYANLDEIEGLFDNFSNSDTYPFRILEADGSAKNRMHE